MSRTFLFIEIKVTSLSCSPPSLWLTAAITHNVKAHTRQMLIYIADDTKLGAKMDTSEMERHLTERPGQAGRVG